MSTDKKMGQYSRLAVILVVVHISTLASSTVINALPPKEYCIYGQDCWPSAEDFRQLQRDYPTLTVALKGDDGWEKDGFLVLNSRIAEVPGATIYVTNNLDVRAVVNFTLIHNLDLKIVSSGHEFIGRNTAAGCVQVSVEKMNTAIPDLECRDNFDGCMTVGPGVWWLQAYEKADKFNRIILGGAEPSVSVTGWGLGGGHSPYSPKLGLGADQILEIIMVLADLTIVHLNKDGTLTVHLNNSVTHSDETDLFWAIRGGGGGTFGIVTSLTYRMHKPPSKFTTMSCTFGSAWYPKKTMKVITKGLRPVIADLPEEFGGYIFKGVSCYEVNPCKHAVYAIYIFTHYGAKSDNADSFSKLADAISKLSKYQGSGPCETKEYDTFYEYVKTLPNVTRQSIDMSGTFISPSEYSDDFLDEHAKVVASAFRRKQLMSSTWIRLGGQTKNDSSGATAINPLFRNAMFTVAYGGDDKTLQKFDEMVDEKVATKGQYFSECDDDLELEEWQNQFWGSDNYAKLMDVKRKYDPDNHFNCKMCVGDDFSGSGASVLRASLIACFTLLVLLQLTL